MSIPLTFRKAVKADIPAILKLYSQPEIDKGATLSPAAAEKLFEKITGYPDYCHYVAETEKGIIGTFALLIMDNLGHMGAPSAIVEDVAVAPEHQGLGVGKRMMKYALDKSAEKNCYKLTLSSNLKRKSAHKFYESLGFERHGYSFLLSPLSLEHNDE